jgi:hypothetical protein
MRWRQVGLFYVVAATLAAEYLLVEQKRARTQQTRPAARARFLDVTADGVREIRLHHGGRTVVTRRSEGRWTVTEPADASIPSDLVTAFVEALMGAEEIEHVAGGSAQASAFGLDDTAAAARVELLRGDGAPVVVTIGGTNPTGTAVYARRGDRPEVILIGRNVRYYEDLIFQALPAGHVPASDGEMPVGG